MRKIRQIALTLLSSVAMLFAVNAVNSVCGFWVYEEKMPDEAKKLIKE